MHIELLRPVRTISGGGTPDWAALEREWRTLEAAADGSLFQSWTWLGCRVAARFTDPWLVRATVAGRVVGLALFNRTGPTLARTLWLHETGRRGEDSVFIEHNGPLLARGHEALLRPMLAAAARHGRLMLSGVDDAVLAAAQTIGQCHVAVTREAPFARLDQLRDGAEWLESLGASTRYRLRRSRRLYERAGRVALRRAAEPAEALAFVDALAALHQARWTARGQPGAFAEPAFLAFHREFLARGLPRGEVELLQIAVDRDAGSQVLGYLYNLRWRDTISTYQGGFDYAAAEPHQLPGLTCHQVAIEAAIASGSKIYDFLAGESQYKTSLGNATRHLHWLELVGRGTAYDMPYRIRAVLRRGQRDDQSLKEGQSLSGSAHPPNEPLAWPMAAAVIGALSLLVWVAVGYLLRWALHF
jgi:CelD/BcsL family acetyltransferase involved in cellulose biosynthesis